MNILRVPVRNFAGVLIVSALGLAACTSGSGQAPPGMEASDPQPLPSSVLAGSPAPGFSLPSPAQLAKRLPGSSKSRSASYVSADLLQQAENFDTTQPHQLVTATAGGATFAPDWHPGNERIGAVSFALYKFTIPGYDGNPSLYYSWITPPTDAQSVYIALANWGKNRWDWYAGNTPARIDLASLAPYFTAGGAMYACFLRTGTDASELDWLRVGSLPPLPALTESLRYGLIPYTVNFDASGSTDPDGTIAEYKWDPQGDGTFDQSSGQTPTFSFEYTTAGEFHPTVRVIDNDGVYCDLALNQAATGAANFSYGAPGYDDQPRSILVCDDGHLLMVGERAQGLGDVQALITKVAPSGTADFTKAWGAAGGDRLMDAVLADDSYVYACGLTASYGQGNGDALLQKWTQDGQLVWSRTIGSADDTETFRALLIRGDSIYVCGQYLLHSINRYLGFVARLDREGNVTWSHTLIGPEDSWFTDAAFYSPIAIGTPAMRVCGLYYVGASDSEALYASYDENGNRLDCKTWGTAGVSETGVGISIVGGALPATYVTGAIHAASHATTFLGRPGGTTVEISSGLDESLDCYGMQALNVLMRRYISGGQYSMVVGRFNGSLALVGQTEVTAIPDGSNLANAIISYGGTGLVLTGEQNGLLPAASTISLTVQTSATTWTDISPSEGSPSQLVVADTPTDLTELTNFGFNNDSTSDYDAFVYLDRF